MQRGGINPRSGDRRLPERNHGSDASTGLRQDERVPRGASIPVASMVGPDDSRYASRQAVRDNERSTSNINQSFQGVDGLTYNPWVTSREVPDNTMRSNPRTTQQDCHADHEAAPQARSQAQPPNTNCSQRFTAPSNNAGKEGDESPIGVYRFIRNVPLPIYEYIVNNNIQVPSAASERKDLLKSIELILSLSMVHPPQRSTANLAGTTARATVSPVPAPTPTITPTAPDSLSNLPATIPSVSAPTLRVPAAVQTVPTTTTANQETEPYPAPVTVSQRLGRSTVNETRTVVQPTPRQPVAAPAPVQAMTLVERLVDVAQSDPRKAAKELFVHIDDPIVRNKTAHKLFDKLENYEDQYEAMDAYMQRLTPEELKQIEAVERCRNGGRCSRRCGHKRPSWSWARY